jgi:hypothetical protein
MTSWKKRAIFCFKNLINYKDRLVDQDKIIKWYHIPASFLKFIIFLLLSLLIFIIKIILTIYTVNFLFNIFSL